ncbi:MAG TPA: hydroxymethylbilane synthase, partial [Chroococcales cyanobacterium]
MQRIVVATRGSALALSQTSKVMDLLQRAAPQYHFERLVVRTRADLDQSLFGAEEEGAFVRELEVALREGTADLAVHHFKDVPQTLLAGLILPAIPFRGDAREAFVSTRYPHLLSLPDGATIATRGLRRRAQLLAINPTWRFSEVWGSLDRRLLRLKDGSIDGMVLAAYGLDALNYGIKERIPFARMLPAAAQGAIALECREEDRILKTILSSLDEPRVRAVCVAERAFFQGVFGGYRVPAGVHGEIVGDRLFLEGLLALPDGSFVHRASIEGPLFAPEILGNRLARAILGAGGFE